jgi:tetratricopeptide (TPR) repeat protein
VEYQHNNVDALFDWGTALFKSARQQEAVQKYLQAIRMSPRTLKRVYIIGDLLRRNETVVRRFQSVIDDIRMAASYTEWGALLTDIGRYELAIQQHQQAVQLDPDLKETCANWLKTLGRAGISAGDPNRPVTSSVVVGWLLGGSGGANAERRTDP